MEKKILRLIIQFFNDPSTAMKYRMSDKAFVKKRKLPFVKVALCIMTSVRRSIQSAVIKLFSDENIQPPTKSAFCQSRKKFSHSFFIDAGKLLVSKMYALLDMKRWHNHRLVAVDGSYVNLPRSAELVDSFGEQSNQYEKYPMASISCSYDVMNHVIIGGVIEKCSCDEYERACKLSEDTHPDDIWLYDRGYGAYWFFNFLDQIKQYFVIRVSKTCLPKKWYNKEKSKIHRITSMRSEGKAKLRKYNKKFVPFQLRVISIKLDTGEIETIVTNLLDKGKYPDEIFKELYFRRWGVEELFKHLKIHDEIENISGKSKEVVLQDFYSSIFVENIRVLIEHPVNEKLEAASECNKSKYKYQVNRNISCGVLKDHLIKLLTSGDDLDVIFDKITSLFKYSRIPVIKERHYPRKRDQCTSKKRFFISIRRAI